MPSNAYNLHFVVLMQDVEELLKAHEDLKSGSAGRQWGIGALNRSAVVMALSCWEQYVESLANELVQLQRPAVPAGTGWPTLQTAVASSAGALNTPSSDKVQALILKACGLADVTAHWTWRYHTVATDNQDKLRELIELRGDIAHGVNPRPIVHNTFAKEMVRFLTHLAQATDVAVANHVVTALGLPRPW